MKKHFRNVFRFEKNRMVYKFQKKVGLCQIKCISSETGNVTFMLNWVWPGQLPNGLDSGELSTLDESYTLVRVPRYWIRFIYWWKRSELSMPNSSLFTISRSDLAVLFSFVMERNLLPSPPLPALSSVPHQRPHLPADIHALIPTAGQPPDPVDSFFFFYSAHIPERSSHTFDRLFDQLKI